MNRKQWLQVTRIFTDALEVDREKRDQWLDDVCGEDNELYKEVQSLLKAYTSPGLPDLSLNKVRQSAVSWMELQDKKGRQIGPYQLHEMIGRGGMGVVYRAYDCRLNRDVAIKFPPQYWSLNEQTKKRFLNEARIAASLDHPNICTIYEADELDDGTLFMAMAFYQGETLQQRLEQGPLDLDDAVDLIIQTARGLEAAHEKGLVHRDIKPSNLILTQNGTLKILDFGIAMAADEGITFPKQQPGTEAYMSPEQAHGGRVDKRTDLWSMGVVFYEMLTGELPGKERVSLSSLHPEIPAWIDELLCQLLDPDPDNRLQSAGELAAALETKTGQFVADSTGPRKMKHLTKIGLFSGLILLLTLSVISAYQVMNGNSLFNWATGESVVSHTLAVLPFNNISGDSGDEYYSDGISEDLLTYLARNSGFSVISRSSVMHYKDSGRAIPDIGRELGATHIINGSVQRADNRVRINVQLIDAVSGHQLWGDRYDRELEDIFEIQTDIVRSIAERLEGHILNSSDITEPGILNAEAHDLYLQGRFHWHRRSEDGLRKAAEFFEKAVDIVPEYSTAWEGLADAYAVLGFYDYLAPDQSFPKAREAARRALELKPNSASAWASLGYVALYYDWDLEWGEAAFRRSINLDPRSSKTRQWYANLLTAAGRFDEAEREMLHAQELDPLSLIANAALGWVYYQAGKNEDAIRQLNFTLELNPDFELAYLWKGWTLESMERYDEALEMLEEAVSRSTGSNIVVASLARLHGLRGETDKAESLLRELETNDAYIPAYEIGKAYLGLNQIEKAAEWLERAVLDRSHSIVFLEVDPQINKYLDIPPISSLAASIRAESGRDK